MEICGLEEAKKHLEQFIEQSKKYLLTIEDDHTQYTRNKYVEMCKDVKAIDTVLRALEEYESKLDNYTWEELDEIEKKIIELKKKKYSSSIKQKKYKKNYNEKHKEQNREWQRQWRKNNPEKVKEIQRRYTEKQKLKNSE